MSEVKGIGGVFIDSRDAQRLARWYAENLGITMEAHPDGIGYYHVFSTRDAETALLRENPVFAINQAKESLAEKGRGFVLNFRVDDLHRVLKQLRARKVEVEDRLLEWERGRHGWIRDLDGNKIELYEEIQPDETVEQQ
jgi:catechol 2,3-dioxygenase-like lactoylglutathione lyase family enzyme